MDAIETQRNLMHLLGEGKIEMVILELDELAKTQSYNHLQNLVKGQSIQFKQLQAKRIKGIIDHKEEDIAFNKLVDNLLQIIAKINEPASKTVLETNIIPLKGFIFSRSLRIMMLLGGLTLAGVAIYWIGDLLYDPFEIKVQVHGNRTDILPLRGEGKVRLHLPSDLRSAAIKDDGVAAFDQIPAKFIGKKIKITVDHPQPWRSITPDSLFVLHPDENYEIAVRLFQSDKIVGYVYDFFQETALDSVRVSIHPNIFTFTDDKGEFILNIPEEYQKMIQEVSFSKKEYKTEKLQFAPHTQQRAELPLERIRQ